MEATNAYLTCPLFHLKDMRKFRDIIPLLSLHEETFQKGDWILQRGMASKEVLIVLDGKVAELAGTVVQRTLEKNDCFAMALALTQDRSGLSYQALSDCVVGYAPIWALKQHGELMENVCRLMARESEEAKSRMAILTQKTAKEKLSWFLSEQVRLHHSKTFVVPWKRKEIAALLGITPAALYLEIRKREAEGTLKRQQSTWSVLG